MNFPVSLNMDLIGFIGAGFVLLLLIIAGIILKDSMTLLKIRKSCICEADARLISFKTDKMRVKGVYEVLLNGSSRIYESADYCRADGTSPKEGSRVKIMIDPMSPKAVYDPLVSGLLRTKIMTAVDTVVIAALLSSLVVFCFTGLIPL